MPEPRPEIATILFTDIVSSTALMQRVGDDLAQRLFQDHHDFLRDAVRASFGDFVEWTGDGVMAIFESASDALHYAMAVQRTERQTDGERLRLRVGLNVGEVLRQDVGSGYFGTPVVIARRLCDKARAGQILCSTTVAGLLAGNSRFRFRALGEFELKGIAQSVAVAEVVYGWRRPSLSLKGFEYLGKVPDIVVATDELGRIVYLNEAAEQVLGCRSKEVVGNFVVEFYPSLEEARRVMAAIRDHQSGGPDRLANFQTIYRNKAGNDIPVMMSAAILHDEDGAPAGTIGIARELRRAVAGTNA
jgi:PAS domain S-box-containing protein